MLTKISTRHVYEMDAIGPKTSKELYGPQKIPGACLDPGAEKSVMGAGQATAYGRVTGRKPTARTSPSSFRFRDVERIRKGKMEVRITKTTGQKVAIRVHNVEADIPLLVGIEVLSAEDFILEFGANVIRESTGDGRSQWCVRTATYSLSGHEDGYVIPITS